MGHGERHFFPGANTPQGFYSRYDSALAGAEYVYIIKGGPGTGKSGYMKRVARAAREKGVSVEYMHCSSDPFSLDGIILGELGFAMVDGTSPHVIDAAYPGARESLIDLSRFWDTSELRRRAEGIMETSVNIKYEFARAYKYLAAAKNMRDVNDSIYARTLDKKAIENAAIKHADELCRCAGDAPQAASICERSAFAGGVTPSGQINYIASLVSQCKRVYSITGAGAPLYLDTISRALARGEICAERYYCPMSPSDRIEHIVIPAVQTALLTHNRHHSVHMISNDVIDMTEYSDIQTAALSARILADNERMYDKLINMAISALKDAYWLHNSLEAYYIPNMDFAALDRDCSSFIERMM